VSGSIRSIRLRAGARTFDVDAVLLDKDGTLIDLDAYWAPAARRWIEEAAGGDAHLARALRRRLGFDAERGIVVRSGPFATMTLAELADLTSRLLEELGIGGPEARARAGAARRDAADASMQAPIVPIGDVAGSLGALHRAGLAVAVVTSDDRRAAERALEAIGTAGLVDLLVCGDDGAPAKPDPGLVTHVAERFGTVPRRVLLVGDTELDRRMAEGAGGFVAVAPPMGSPPAADAVVSSIEDLRIVGPTGRSPGGGPRRRDPGHGGGPLGGLRS